MNSTELMSDKEKIAQAKSYIRSGMPVYKAVQMVGMELQRWYRLTSGVDGFAKRRRVVRLRDKRKKLLDQVGLIDKQIAELIKELN